MNIESLKLRFPLSHERQDVREGPEAPRPTVLIVEDESGPREAMKVILRPFFNLHEAAHPTVALQILKEQPIDLVTLDLKLPGKHGIELLRQIKNEREDIEAVIITGYGTLETAMDGIRYGAAAYLLKPFNITELIEVINQALEKKRRLDGLRGALRTFAGLWGRQGDPGTICKDLSKVLASKHPELVRHAERVSFYALLIADRVELSATEREALQVGAFLHDIGQVGFDPRLVRKSNEQGDQEPLMLKRHVDIGARLALGLPFLPDVSQIIRHHHEHYDGSGYPDGLRGEDIPYLARIVCLGNTFDNLLVGSSHQQALTQEEAREYVRRQAGALFDPSLAEALVQALANGGKRS